MRIPSGDFCPLQVQKRQKGLVLPPLFAGRHFLYAARSLRQQSLRPWLEAGFARFSAPTSLTLSGYEPKLYVPGMPPTHPQPASAYGLLYLLWSWKQPILFCKLSSTFKRMFASISHALSWTCSEWQWSLHLLCRPSHVASFLFSAYFLHGAGPKVPWAWCLGDSKRRYWRPKLGYVLQLRLEPVLRCELLHGASLKRWVLIQNFINCQIRWLDQPL